MTDDRAPLPFARPLPPAFRRRTVTLDAGDSRPFDPDEWADALILIEDGVLELECLDGERRRFHRGHVIWLDGLPLRCLRNPGAGPAVLVAVSRWRGAVR
ncbi:MAG TPA: hypothetical protein VGR06_23855 [Actinophytocola sp.]|jgi:hypothetical protein|uniref:hypothetical protein n=1 Tax=Actinophytocola sp. TaxID=1872138 RepID=UPI002E0C164E|nr:hypothetical protein [Actinophytocola sp.]